MCFRVASCSRHDDVMCSFYDFHIFHDSYTPARRVSNEKLWLTRFNRLALSLRVERLALEMIIIFTLKCIEFLVYRNICLEFQIILSTWTVFLLYWWILSILCLNAQLGTIRFSFHRYQQLLYLHIFHQKNVFQVYIMCASLQYFDSVLCSIFCSFSWGELSFLFCISIHFCVNIINKEVVQSLSRCG